MAGFKSAYESYVVEHCGLYYVAEQIGEQYIVPMTHRSKRKTGCNDTVCKTRNALPRAGGYIYPVRAKALARAKEIYGRKINESP